MIDKPKAGQVVRVLEPFDQIYPDTYALAEVITHEDGQRSCLLVDVEGAFDPRFLKLVEG